MIRPLRSYQRKALRYLLAKKSGALFMEMRLGKTLVVCRYAKAIRARVCLVVAPGSALGSWERELAMEGLPWQSAAGGKSRKQRTTAFQSVLSLGGFLLLNREGWRALPQVREVVWDLAVLDESTFVKNPKAQVTKFYHKLLAHRKVVLTGTPDPEGVQDVYCQLRYLWPAPMGFENFWQFRSLLMAPNYGGYGWSMMPGASDAVRRWMGLHCFCLRRRDVGLRENRVYERRRLEFDSDTQDIYDTVEEEFRLGNLETLWAGQRWHWMRQLCGGHADGVLCWDGKLREVLELLAGELAGEQVVIWACYDCEIKRLGEWLTDAGVGNYIITGAIAPQERARRIEAFQDNRCRVLVLQQAVAQTGLDLSAADTAIYYSTPLGQAARAQTEDRILTVDKARRGVPLLYIDLVVRNTVDEDALEVLEAKDASAEATMRRALQEAMKRRRKWV